MTALSNYFNRVEYGDATAPSKDVQLSISKALDAATERAVTEIKEVIKQTHQNQACVQVLNQQTRTAGKYGPEKVLFTNTSSIEQMVAVESWLGQRQIRSPHTFFFSAGDNDYIPLKANKLANKVATTMHVVLGATRGDHKAPKYKDWAISDPRETAAQALFMDPLESLEIVRQPAFSAATLIKGHAFEQDLVDEERRYGSKFACVEDRNQSKNTPKKQRSAGLNACTLLEECSDINDPRAEDVELLSTQHLEEYGALEEASVTPGSLMEATKKAILRRDTHDLDVQMQTLLLAKLSPAQSEDVQDYVVETWQNNWT